MNPVDPVNSSLYFNATLEANRSEAKKLNDRKTGSAGVGGTKKSLFSKLMSEAAEEKELPISNDIPEIAGMSFEKAETFLIDEVYSMGELLKQKPIGENFTKYKKAVSNFLKFVQKECYEVEDITGMRPAKKPGRPIKKGKRYKLVKIVNEKLDNLAADILLNQKNQIAMAAKINEIAGLLVDVFY